MAQKSHVSAQRENPHTQTRSSSVRRRTSVTNVLPVRDLAQDLCVISSRVLAARFLDNGAGQVFL
jgi:hypothetical protein